jgi:hypothetical protein
MSTPHWYSGCIDVHQASVATGTSGMARVQDHERRGDEPRRKGPYGRRWTFRSRFWSSVPSRKYRQRGDAAAGSGQSNGVGQEPALSPTHAHAGTQADRSPRWRESYRSHQADQTRGKFAGGGTACSRRIRSAKFAFEAQLRANCHDGTNQQHPGRRLSAADRNIGIARVAVSFPSIRATICSSRRLSANSCRLRRKTALL